MVTNKRRRGTTAGRAMRKASVTVAACATLLWAGTALATPTPQQLCDSARITAWKVYTSCVDTVVAKDAKGVLVTTGFDQGNLIESAAFAKCRHAYFNNWKGFQSNRSLTGSTCKVGVDNRFTEDLVDGVVTDNLTGLVWELKDNQDGTQNYTDPHDTDNSYSLSTGAPWAENGTAFTTFLTDPVTGLNVTGFAGANGWRLPTLAELQTIVLDFPCTGAFGGPTCICTSNPCVDPALDAANTRSDLYWSATSDVPDPSYAWYVNFFLGFVNTGDHYNFDNKTGSFWVRAVRGGL